jgi:uncharacterized protein
MKSTIKIILIIIGTLSIALGVVGIIVPLLPTTPLILLGAVCYVKSSESLYQKLIRNKWLGGYIKDFRENKGITKKNKAVSITMLWLSITASMLIMHMSFLISSILIITAVTVSAYILSFDTL